MTTDSGYVPQHGCAISVAVIGAGPATAYLLAALATKANGVCPKISIFESSAIVGRGTPYNAYSSQYQLLSNLGADEIPSLHIAFSQWCVDNHIQFQQKIVPRYLIGQYLEHAFRYYMNKLGSRLSLYTQCPVVRIEPTAQRTYRLHTATALLGTFDYVVVNTGHGSIFHHAETEPQYTSAAAHRYFDGPYPLQKILNTELQELVLRGASLSAIDCALAVAHKYGSFSQQRGKYSFHARKPLHITMYSTSGKLPGPWFASLDLVAPITEAINQLIGDNTSISLEAVFKAGFVDFLAKYAPSVYLQIRSMAMHQVIDYLLSNRALLDVNTLLKIEYISSSNNAANQENWQGVLECFGDCLHACANELSAQDKQRYESVLKPFIAKANAALPATSAAKIHALLRAGNITLISQQISRDTFAKGLPRHIDTALYVDCTSSNNLSGVGIMLQPLIEAGYLTHTREEITEPLDLNVTPHFEAINAHNRPAGLFIGAQTLLGSTLMTLPGLSLSHTIAGQIAHRLVTGKGASAQPANNALAEASEDSQHGDSTADTTLTTAG